MQTLKNRNLPSDFHEVYKEWTGFHQVAGTIYCIMSDKIAMYSAEKTHKSFLKKKMRTSLDYYTPRTVML